MEAQSIAFHKLQVELELRRLRAQVAALGRELGADDRGDGAILARPVTDTIKQADADTRIRATLDRSLIWRALTPQLFDAGRLHDALHSALRDDPEAITDEASALFKQIAADDGAAPAMRDLARLRDVALPGRHRYHR